MLVNSGIKRVASIACRLMRAAQTEREWWRDARAARREYVTLGCRSNAEIDRLPAAD